jgi:hypothetical protein
LRVAEATLPTVEEYALDNVDDLRGIADGSGLSLVDIALFQSCNPLLTQHEFRESLFSVIMAPVAREM